MADQPAYRPEAPEPRQAADWLIARPRPRPGVDQDLASATLDGFDPEDLAAVAVELVRRLLGEAAADG